MGLGRIRPCNFWRVLSSFWFYFKCSHLVFKAVVKMSDVGEYILPWILIPKSSASGFADV